MFFPPICYPPVFVKPPMWFPPPPPPPPKAGFVAPIWKLPPPVCLPPKIFYPPPVVKVCPPLPPLKWVPYMACDADVASNDAGAAAVDFNFGIDLVGVAGTVPDAIG